MDDRVEKNNANPDATATGKKSGSTVDPGPYEAIVVSHVQGTRMGQLGVYIPDWGGIPDPANPTIVSYASPFYGTTFGTGTQQLPNTSATSGQSYGMWMVPPDVGCKVLVMFVAGNKARGYWFACCYDSPNHHMVPGLGRDIGGTGDTVTNPAISGYLSGDTIPPVTEYNTKTPGSYSSQGLVNTPRFAHDFQTMTLIQQGLDRDPIRGAISSSSMRESPSNVYGISTPGRRATSTDQIAGSPQKTVFRKGGHQFVMDDGAEDGTDQLIRLRTSGGHQILMNDTEKILYIASATGAQWLEFSSSGAINIYGAAGFNLRTSGGINMHSDSSITMNAPSISINALGSTKSPLAALSLKSSGTFGLEAIGTGSIKTNGALSLSSFGAVNVSAGAILSLGAIGAATLSGSLTTVGSKSSVIIQGATIGLNPAGPKPFTAIKPPMAALGPIPMAHALPDTLFSEGTKSWIPNGTINLTTCSVAPAHEPWLRAKPVGNLIGAAIGMGGSLVSGAL
jgi:hypothetical protein